MVDLKGQYASIADEVKAGMKEVMETTAFINGPQVGAFQKDLEDYLKVKHVIPCANGTDALQIALMTLGLEPGDEVITTDFTFAATVEVIGLLRLKPILVDVELETFNIAPEEVEKAITSKTKAIIPVHLFGQVANMSAILKIAKKHKIHVVEDNAQAIGATYTFEDGTTAKAGTMGTVGTTSFFPSKNLGAYGDGGALFTNNDELAYRIRGIVNHGMYRRYYHDVIGVNSRLDSLQAVILKVKLQYLDSYNERRRSAAVHYTRLLKDNPHIETPKIVGTAASHVFHQYTLCIKNGKRDALVNHLNENNISCAIYYPVPLHAQQAYASTEYNEAHFEITNQLVKEVISLPMHTELTPEQITHISEHILRFLE